MTGVSRKNTAQCHMKNVMLTFVTIVWAAQIVYGQILNPSASHTNLQSAENKTSSESDPAAVIKNESTVLDPCDAFYQEYIKAVGNFTHCEVAAAKPFKLCMNCVEQYTVVSVIFRDLIEKPSLQECKVKYMKSDRVQIIPNIQKNIDALWKDSNCHGCYDKIHINAETKEVNYTRPEQLIMFLKLYCNFSLCINKSFPVCSKEDLRNSIGNVSSMCKTCKDKYVKLNNHFDSISDRWESDICMDMTEMMNDTRHIWNSQMNCTHRDGDSMPVIVISIVVGTTPIFFYVTLRITGKVRRKKIFKQKRLGNSQDITVHSRSQSSGETSSMGSGNYGATSQRLTHFT